MTERMGQVMGAGKGGSILVHIGAHNADMVGTRPSRYDGYIVKKYRNLLKRTKQARVGQIILSGILPVIGGRNHGYRNSRRMAINRLVQQLCREEDVGFVNLWSSFVAKEERYTRDGLHLSGKGAGVFADGLKQAVDSGFGNVHYLN